MLVKHNSMTFHQRKPQKFSLNHNSLRFAKYISLDDIISLIGISSSNEKKVSIKDNDTQVSELFLHQFPKQIQKYLLKKCTIIEKVVKHLKIPPKHRLDKSIKLSEILNKNQCYVLKLLSDKITNSSGDFERKCSKQSSQLNQLNYNPTNIQKFFKTIKSNEGVQKKPPLSIKKELEESYSYYTPPRIEDSVSENDISNLEYMKNEKNNQLLDSCEYSNISEEFNSFEIIGTDRFENRQFIPLSFSEVF